MGYETWKDNRPSSQYETPGGGVDISDHPEVQKAHAARIAMIQNRIKKGPVMVAPMPDIELIELAQLNDLPNLPPGEFHWLSDRRSFGEAYGAIPQRLRDRVVRCHHFAQGKKGQLWYFEMKATGDEKAHNQS
jgi:hypothetical protein